jgi:uncharacterized membrane protein YphA (DoxX/SURF4 family)
MIVVALAVRWFVAVMLIVAGIAKLGRTDAFSEAISRYGILPDALTPSAARVIPIVELLLGILLAAGVVVTLAAIACASLLGAFAAVVAINLVQGKSFDCGCGLNTDARISWSHVARATTLSGLSVLVAVEPVVFAISGGRVVGAPSTRELVAVPLGVVLLCVSWRLLGPLTNTVSALTGSRRATERLVASPTVEA